MDLFNVPVVLFIKKILSSKFDATDLEGATILEISSGLWVPVRLSESPIMTSGFGILPEVENIVLVMN